MRLPPNNSVTVLPGEVAICKLPHDTNVGQLIDHAPLYSVTRTDSEVSLVCPVDAAPADVPIERGWRILKVTQILDFAQPGLLASLLDPLVRERVTVFVISTFSTDYVLVKETDLQVAVTALRIADHPVEVIGEPALEPPPPLHRDRGESDLPYGSV